MTIKNQRDALAVIGASLKKELERADQPAKPDIERALRRLLERDLNERSRPHNQWSGKSK
jgi:hypothetical protein